VLIIGAGLSGIGAGVHLQTNCPGKSYAILESRPASGAQPAASQTVVLLVKNEKINQPIPDSTFHFTPPPGAKEMQAGGMGFGMPGAGGARRLRHGAERAMVRGGRVSARRLSAC